MATMKYVRGLGAGGEGKRVDAWVSRSDAKLNLTRRDWSAKVALQDVAGAHWNRVGVLRRNTELVLAIRGGPPLVLEGEESALAKLYEAVVAAQAVKTQG